MNRPNLIEIIIFFWLVKNKIVTQFKFKLA